MEDSLTETKSEIKTNKREIDSLGTYYKALEEY
jgi:hypothetical protein